LKKVAKEIGRTYEAVRAKLYLLRLTKRPSRAVQAVLNGYPKGWSDREISDRAGISQSLVTAARNSLGLKPRGVLMKLFKLKDRVRISTPDNDRLNGKEAVVESVEPWGCHLTGTGVGTGKFRALWSEMALLDSAEIRAVHAKEMGYHTDPCPNCGMLTLKRSGSCFLCDSCQESSGCS
jgi:hypothetical protein